MHINRVEFVPRTRNTQFGLISLLPTRGTCEPNYVPAVVLKAVYPKRHALRMSQE